MAACEYGVAFKWVSIIPDKDQAGVLQLWKRARHPARRTIEDRLHADQIIDLAGAWAQITYARTQDADEEAVWRAGSAAKDDFEKAWTHAELAVSCRTKGQGDALVVHQELEKMHDEAQAFVSRCWPLVRAVATALIENEKLTRREVTAILRKAGWAPRTEYGQNTDNPSRSRIVGSR